MNSSPPDAPRPARWTLRMDGVRGGAEGALNMALDHATALFVAGDQAVLRLYRWDRPTLSLGRNEPTRGVYDPDALADSATAVVRRPTGGRAVLHDREVTYAVAAPARSFGGLRSGYLSIHRALARGLLRLGVPVEVAGPTHRAPLPSGGPCFRDPAAGELVARGRKLVGSAQARIGRALLQHGSILIEDRQAMVQRLRREPSRDEAAGSVGISTLLGRSPSFEEVAEAVAAGFREEMGGVWAEGTEEAEDENLPAELLAHYRSKEWTWRR